jgi:hypothetical protein
MISRSCRAINNQVMDSAIQRFLSAHERYLELDRVRTECNSPQEREVVYIEILRAYLEVQYHAMIITGIQTAEGMEFARAN